MERLVVRRVCGAGITLLTAFTIGACSSGSAGGGTAGSGGDSGAHATAPTAPAAAHSSGTAAAKSGSAVGGGARDLASFCSLLGRNSRILTDIAAGDQRRSGVDAQKLIADLDSAVAAAPAAIKSDLQVIVDFDKDLLQHHRDIKETPQLTQSMQHYATWIGKHCAGNAASIGGTP